MSREPARVIVPKTRECASFVMVGSARTSSRYSRSDPRHFFESRVARSSLISCSNEGWLSIGAAPLGSLRYFVRLGTGALRGPTFTDVCKLGRCVFHRIGRSEPRLAVTTY